MCVSHVSQPLRGVVVSHCSERCGLRDTRSLAGSAGLHHACGAWSKFLKLLEVERSSLTALKALAESGARRSGAAVALSGASVSWRSEAPERSEGSSGA